MASEQHPAESPGIAELMNALQARARDRITNLSEAIATLRSSLIALKDESSLQELAGNQSAANDLFSQLQATRSPFLDRPFLTEGEIAELEVLASPPGLSRPWWHPKRWFAAFYRMLWGRQELFNRRLLEHLRRLTAMVATEQIRYAITARLMGSVNTLVRRACERDYEFEAVMDKLVQTLDEFIELSPQTVEAQAVSEAWQKMWEPYAIELETIRKFLPRIRDLESQVGALADELQRRIEAGTASDRILEAHLNEISQKLQDLERSLATQTDVARAYAADTAALPSPEQASPQSPKQSLSPTFSFYEFEESLRGGEVQIAAEQSKYVAWFEGAEPVLDAGCGRGEFLDLLRVHNIRAYGIDADEAMVAHCAAKGHRVLLAKIHEHLESLDDETLGGIFLGQVVEHLERHELMTLPYLAWRKLIPNGVIVIETVNPMCLTTFSGAFYADPTHIRPIHPKGLEFLLTMAGFVEPTLILSAPVPEHDKLQLLCEKEPLAPAVKDVVMQMNRNLERLNALLYSYANYAIAARKGAA
ncbi:MAG: methyltransferase domain-containing protein [Candidatus Hydrogenedentota bacterium]|uniref:Methyltransferase type 11 domain-containing protein n=1 Tax=Sumerlaea chitinivorans TaxID=2250252 RepID=A0A2Z4Y1Q9_SUMC1|nr:hypothetical protein BRCON_0122 [Candidatus Sumerlaea chitinivorans]MCX7962955.1 class I SAM-dependent methyltransferase [Candidatus Sumerlaea chitinivorans]RMH23793.1 MAG: methyltransferase domain-containing protein [Candidatus Hydrogenedentota bacterium]GIX44848.1 MAG: hypothetical protein KatS3mg130_1256 [Candidatus Sumerlaea sp.]